MKKILVLLLAVLTLIAFVACDTGNGSSSPVGTGTESESGTGTGSTGSEGGNTGSGSTGGSTGGNGSSSTGGNGSGSTGGSTGSEGGSISESRASVENLSYDSDNLNNKIFRRVDGDGDIKYHLFKDGKCYESSSSETFSKEDDDDPIIISYKDKFYRLDPSKVCNRESGNGLFATFTAGNGVTITLKSDGTGSASDAQFNFTNANGEITLSIFPSWKVLYDGSKLFLIMDPDNNELIFVKNHN